MSPLRSTVSSNAALHCSEGKSVAGLRRWNEMTQGTGRPRLNEEEMGHRDSLRRLNLAAT